MPTVWSSFSLPSCCCYGNPTWQIHSFIIKIEIKLHVVAYTDNPGAWSQRQEYYYEFEVSYRQAWAKEWDPVSEKKWYWTRKTTPPKNPLSDINIFVCVGHMHMWDNMVLECLISHETVKLFSKMILPSCILTNTVWEIWLLLTLAKPFVLSGLF